jgi:hypothetical protein
MKMRSLAYIASVFGMLGCGSAPAPVDGVDTSGASKADLPTKDKIDILFLVDNSPSMEPKQTELKARFPALVDKLQQFASSGHKASYHIGVVTTDLGAGPFTLGAGGQCHPGGDGAKLQGLGAAADPKKCGPLGGGLRFVDYDQVAGTDNLPSGQSLEQTFACMASVGAVGCGFEQPLESVYQALHDPIDENKGFLRPDALLVVVFLTDEDDCSAPPDTDLFSPDAAAKYGLLHSFRCTRFGLVCGGALPPDADSGGPLAMCAPASAAEGGKLIDVNKYINFFTQPASSGGVKSDPRDVALIAIAGPADPVVVKNSTPCFDSSAPSCAILQHSCVTATDASIGADPAVRLSAVINAVPDPDRRREISICSDDYAPAFDQVASAIAPRLH